MGSRISAISYAVGAERLTHECLCGRFGADVMEKIAKSSGILQRRVAPVGVCASDLAKSAADSIFKNVKVAREEIDLLIFATQTADYRMPSSACILQERLALAKSCAAFDINLGCSQFVYALATAKAWLESNLAKKALVLAGDTPTHLLNPKDKSTVSLFGDGACACLVESSANNSLIDFVFGTDGAGYKSLICEYSGMRKFPQARDYDEFEDENGNIRRNVDMYVDGLKIFTFARKAAFEAVSKLLSRNGISIDAVDLFIFHQAGEKVVNYCATRLKIPANKVYFKMHDIGNCGGSSVAIALADAAMKGVLKDGMRVVLCSFGVGLSWNAALIKWSKSFKGAFTDCDFADSPAKPLSQSAADIC